LTEKSILDEPLPAENPDEDSTSIFAEEHKTEKQKQAEHDRQMENLMRVGWGFAKFGAVFLLVLGKGLRELGDSMDKAGTRANAFLDKNRPKKKNLKKDVAKAMGIKLAPEPKKVKRVSKK